MFEEYCCGCGLCAGVKHAPFIKDVKGFYHGVEHDDAIHAFFTQVCPAGGAQCARQDAASIWGKTLGTYTAYSKNEIVRHKASSGGVLTELCRYLLDTKTVDAVLHTGEDPQNPIATVLLCSTTADELMRGCGSRYTSSSPLLDIGAYLESNKRYAFVGKPCDVTALRNYAKIDERVNQRFPYMFSFLCAGAPSEKANQKLLSRMGCGADDCVTLRYRGDGWPGYAKATDRDGNEYTLPYSVAWGEILGRDTRLICRFCLDGIGEMADISCGDAWYLDGDQKPVFTEADGRNIVFCRTEAGQKLWNAVYEKQYVAAEDFQQNMDEIRYMQPYQYTRRASMHSSLVALKLVHKEIPKYDMALLRQYAKNMDFLSKSRRFFGVLKRYLQGKLSI